MIPADSASSASPFSAKSTLASSPEPNGQTDQKPDLDLLDNARNGRGQGQMANLSGALEDLMRSGQMPSPSNGQNLPKFPSSKAHSPRSSASPPALGDLRMTASQPASSSSKAATPSRTSASGSRQGGTRSEPPRRTMDVDRLPVGQPTPSDLVRSVNTNKVLLQGDPQVITKQRVETAIRVIVDLLRQIPRSPSSPPIPQPLSHLILRDNSGNPVSTLERIGTFKLIRLQAGTSTKLSSKKQSLIGPLTDDQILFLEAAVFTSGDNPRRVYACKRCRMRELKRKQMKDANRKKRRNSNNSSDSSATKPQASVKGIASSQDYITGENPEQYDPLRSTQTVEEPVWNPKIVDWRNEIVLFNSSPEVNIVDGSVMWLPFRVICYGKCHGEKNGFRVRFTFRTFTGEIFATGTTEPIRITDDHKTDTHRTKTKINGLTSSTASPSVLSQRRKGQAASAASSRMQSPAPSDAESIASMISEAGAVKHKQTPQVRTKPYERPTGQTTNNDVPRNASISSLHSLTSLSPMPFKSDLNNHGFGQPGQSGTISPGILGSQQGFDFSQGNTGNQINTEAFNNTFPNLPPSQTYTSPSSQGLQLNREDIMLTGNLPQSPTDFTSSLNNYSTYSGLNLSNTQPMSGFSSDLGQNQDVEMSNAFANSLDHIFDTSSHTSFASEYGDGGSTFSTNLPDGSLFSDSGLVPDDMQGYLDLTGGEGDDTVNNGTNFDATAIFNQFNTQSSMPSSSMNGQSLSPYGQNGLNSATVGQVQQNNIQQPVPTLPVPSPQPAQNAPRISTIIPSDGPVAGGTTVAVIGSNFASDSVVLFGDRAAKVQVTQPGFIQCQAPPAAMAGIVEVSIGGVPKLLASDTRYYKYNMMDTDLMMLALQVKDQYAGSSNDAAYRLAQHVASRSQPASDWSGHSSSSPHSGPSAGDGGTQTPMSEASSSSSTGESVTDLQMTVINFLASLDTDAPGALRRSGAINHRNTAEQTLLHIATVMGYHRLVRRLIVIGAHLDLQDVNGYTALGLASLMGRTNCVRVLIEAGAAYDRPTLFGEMPLDLAKIGDHSAVEALLLSAVWSTMPIGQQAPESETSEHSPEFDSSSEIDEDNPSSDESDLDGVSEQLETRSMSRKMRGKQPITSSSRRSSISPIRHMRSLSRRSSLSSTPQPTPIIQPMTPPEAPPPYNAHDTNHRKTNTAADSGSDTHSWMSNLPGSNFKFPVPDAVWDKIPLPIATFLDKHLVTATGSSSAGNNTQERPSTPGGWVAFPAPSWESLQKMTSPEEVKMFTQAMAAAAFNAVIQSGITPIQETSPTPGKVLSPGETRRNKGYMRKRRGRKAGSTSRRNSDSSPASIGSPGSPSQVVKHVRRDRMLYLFWLPVLLFVGFWLAVTALPIATGFCLIYARQITRAIKQRM